MADTYETRIRDVVTSPAGIEAITRLVNVFETADIPVIGMGLSVKVPHEVRRTNIGKLFGNVDVEVVQ